ncbi:hypothetical protein EYZ11_009689 [Aspergillus tanneri]|uniref:Uncharacterized protein n=1 Tax=Aspergillus tanneri TaxID=1220188 RepID=A0A4S3J9D4_9EURO|nr:hypothetical protein EYZ11_009689 [Aspergillus tanneri]
MCSGPFLEEAQQPGASKAIFRARIDTIRLSASKPVHSFYLRQLYSHWRSGFIERQGPTIVENDVRCREARQNRHEPRWKLFRRSIDVGANVLAHKFWLYFQRIICTSEVNTGKHSIPVEPVVAASPTSGKIQVTAPQRSKSEHGADPDVRMLRFSNSRHDTDGLIAASWLGG